MKFKKYIDFYFEYKKSELKPSSFHKYNGILNNYIYPYFANLSCKEANNLRNIRKFLLNINSQSIKGELSNKFIKDVLTVLRGCLDEAYYDEKIEKNNCNLLRPIKAEKTQITPFSYKEVKELLANSEGFFRVYLYIAFYTGMRVGEILALTINDIDFTNNVIRVNKTRGKFGVHTPKTPSSTRDIPIFKPLQNVLYDSVNCKYRISDHIIYNQYHKPFNNPKNIDIRHYKPLLKKLKLKPRRLYETRHTFATNMLISGKYSVNEIARLLGHTSTSMLFKRYTSYIESEIKELNTIFDIYMK